MGSRAQQHQIWWGVVPDLLLCLPASGADIPKGEGTGGCLTHIRIPIVPVEVDTLPKHKALIMGMAPIQGTQDVPFVVRGDMPWPRRPEPLRDFRASSGPARSSRSSPRSRKTRTAPSIPGNSGTDSLGRRYHPNYLGALFFSNLSQPNAQPVACDWLGS